jgi:hypothetical protein
MHRPLPIKIALGMVATLGLTSFAWLAQPPHDGDEEATESAAPARAQAQGPDPKQALAMPGRLIGVRITVGLRDAQPTDWSGELALSEGRVDGLSVLRGEANTTIAGARFTSRTATAAAAKAATKKKAQQAKKQQAKKKKNQEAKDQDVGTAEPVVLLANLDAPVNAMLAITTNKGRAEVRLSDLVPGQGKAFLDGQLALERDAASVRLSNTATEDDYPSIAAGRNGSLWLAYVAYTPERSLLNGAVPAKDFEAQLVPTRNGDQILLRHYDGKQWSPAEPVTGPRLDVWRPTVAVDGKGDVHVAWAQQVDGNWDVYRRKYTPGADGAAGKWSDVERLTRDPGTDFHVVAATDSNGEVWLAWQAWRERNYEILALGPGQDTPSMVSNSKADDWSPAIAADGQGNVYVAWDTYAKGNYDVYLRNLKGDQAVQFIADTPRFEARASLACDDAGRVWVAYEQGDPNWGKDYANGNPERVPVRQSGYALYINRTVRVVCVDQGKLTEPEATVEAPLRRALGNRNASVPRLVSHPRNGLWLVVRHHPLPGRAGETWVSSVLQFDGGAWHGPMELPFSSNLMDNRPALSPTDAGLTVVHSEDQRPNTALRGQDDLIASLVPTSGSVVERPSLVAMRPATSNDSASHPNEAADKARIRDYRIDLGGKSLRLLRGEFHRHTEFTSHNDQDGLLEDAWRYALDAADHDWMGNGDHLNGTNHEYMWWIIQKMTDLHHNRDRFVPVHSYERSVLYPSGHRNVIIPKRGIRPLPIAADQFGTEEGGSPDTKNLYAYLKHFGGMCASHTSATNMGTDWRDNDPDVEPVVEIYQGHRHNYEHFGAPRSPTEATQIGGYQPKGFIWNALDKGYRLGFQSSSDHVSTHWSYAIVLTDDHSRQGVIDAFKKRHCYAATDNIVLDVRSGEHLMGDIFKTNDRPSLKIKALGTAPIARVHVVRDNKYALTTEPKADRIELTYTDDDARPGETHYYYVRVEQADGNLAWASPMWITR